MLGLPGCVMLDAEAKPHASSHVANLNVYNDAVDHMNLFSVFDPQIHMTQYNIVAAVFDQLLCAELCHTVWVFPWQLCAVTE